MASRCARQLGPRKSLVEKWNNPGVPRLPDHKFKVVRRSMTLKLQIGNVLDASCDAILLTMDGAKKGLEGNIARAFSRRWPEAFAAIEDQVRYPVPLGMSVLAKRTADWEEDCPFSLVIMASILHHIDVLDDRQKIRMIQSAFEDAIAIARRFQMRSMATAVLTGGWRLSDQDALKAMLTVSSRQLPLLGSPDGYIFFTVEENLKQAAQIAEDAGVAVGIAFE